MERHSILYPQTQQPQATTVPGLGPSPSDTGLQSQPSSLRSRSQSSQSSPPPSDTEVQPGQPSSLRHRGPTGQPSSLRYRGSGEPSSLRHRGLARAALFPQTQGSRTALLSQTRGSSQGSPPPSDTGVQAQPSSLRLMRQGSTVHSWRMFPQRLSRTGEYFLGPESANTQGSLKVTVLGRS